MKTPLFAVALLFAIPAFAQPQQSANFRMTKCVLDAGGAPSTSTNFRLVSAFGQPSPLGISTSANYSLSGGFLLPVLMVSPLSPIQDLVISSAAPDAKLNWNPRPGAHSYLIYRATDPLFTPGPSNFIGTAADTFYTDSGILSLTDLRNYYIITASSLPATIVADRATEPQTTTFSRPSMPKTASSNPATSAKRVPKK